MVEKWLESEKLKMKVFENDEIQMLKLVQMQKFASLDDIESRAVTKSRDDDSEVESELVTPIPFVIKRIIPLLEQVASHVYHDLILIE